MKVSEAIKNLESKVLKSEENLKHFPKESQGYAANEARIIAYNIAINKLEQIEEPKPEKVEVPDYVAEWFKFNSTDLEGNIASAFRRIGRGEHHTEIPIYAWLNDSSNEPIQTLFKMKVGYTIKPKQYVVMKEDVYFRRIATITPDGHFSSNWGDLDHCVKFSDKKKAEALALLVEGSVEEV